MTRRLLAHALHSSAGSRLLRLLESAESQRSNLLRVLTYHRIDDQDAFDHHMSYLARHYNVVSMSELLDAHKGRHTLPPRSVMITFDDAYENFAECAWPILKQYALPVTVFVPTAFPDRPDQIFWWDWLEQAFSETTRRDELNTAIGRFSLRTREKRERALSELRSYLKMWHHSETLDKTRQICTELQVAPAGHSVLGWDALRQLARQGVTLGAHSRSHPFMNRITPGEAELEVFGSLQDLEREIGEVLPVFAYPDGRYSREVIETLRRAGFALAFTTRRGTNDLRHADPLQLRRINISPLAALPVLRARLVHSSVYLNRWRRFFDRQPSYV